MVWYSDVVESSGVVHTEIRDVIKVKEEEIGDFAFYVDTDGLFDIVAHDTNGSYDVSIFHFDPKDEEEIADVDEHAGRIHPVFETFNLEVDVDLIKKMAKIQIVKRK